MDSGTLSLLQDSLGSTFRPIVPTLPNPYDALDEGFKSSQQIDAAIAAGQHAQQAKQSLAASQQQMSLAAAKSPYELALLQAKADTIPLDKKYNQGVQDAQMRLLNAQADKATSQAGSYATPAPTLDPINPPPPIPDGTISADAGPASSTSAPPPDLSTPSDTVTAPTLSLPGTSGSASAAAPALLGPSASTAPTDSAAPYATTLPGSVSPDVDLNTLAMVSGAEDPATAPVIRNGVMTPGGGAVPDDDDPLPVADNSDGTGTVAGSQPRDLPMIPGDGDDYLPVSNDSGGAAAASGPAGFGGYRVPVSEADLVSQRNYYNQRAAAALANPALNSTPRNQRALQAQLRAEATQLAGAEAQFRKGQTAQIAASRQSKGPSTPASLDLPDGYVSIPRTFSPRGVAGQILTPDEVTDAHTKSDLLQAQKAQEIVKGATGGASVGDLLTDRGNFSDAAGKTMPGQHFFMQNVMKDGSETQVERSLPEDVYTRLRKIVDPLYYGKPYNPGGTDPTVAPSGLPRVKLALGPNAAVLDDGTQPPPAPAPTSTPTQSRLADAVDNLPPGSDAEQQGEKAIAAEQARTADARQAAANEANDARLKPATMRRQMAPLEAEVQQRQDALEQQMQPNPEDPNGAGMSDSVIAQYTTALKQSRAKLLAASDPRNYTLGADGAYQYSDPFRTNSMMTGQTQTVAGTTTTRRVTQ